MHTLYGKEVFDKLSEVVAPKHTAVLVVDVQNGGQTDPSTRNPGKNRGMVVDMLPKLAAFIGKARAAGAQVVWVKNVPRPGEKAGKSLGLRIPAQLRAKKGEPVIARSGPNGFFGTGLDHLLRARGIKTAIVTGIATEGAVDATALDAGHLDFYAIVAEGCIASFNRNLHESALAVLRFRCDVVPAAEIEAEWAKARM